MRTIDQSFWRPEALVFANGDVVTESFPHRAENRRRETVPLCAPTSGWSDEQALPLC